MQELPKSICQAAKMAESMKPCTHHLRLKWIDVTQCYPQKQSDALDTHATVQSIIAVESFDVPPFNDARHVFVASIYRKV